MAIIASGDGWRLEDGTLYINCVGDMPDYATAYGRPPPWYDYREQITSAVIENGVTSIGGSAFANFASLTSVTIPGSVTSIGESAFYGCAALSGVTIPSGATSIGGNAFRNCESITSITIPGSVTSIGVCAFLGSGLTSVTIPGSVTSVPSMAFSECPLSNATIQSGVTSIGGSAFYKCGNLTNVTIPVSVTTISQYAFYDCPRLSSVYYSGTETQWNAITIESDNTPLTSATIHYSEPTPGAVTLSSIVITTPPAKTAYAAGETFSRTGMVVTASYSDGTTAVISNYSVSPSGALTVNDSAVTVSYTEGGVVKTATVAITVTGATPEPTPTPTPGLSGHITYNGASKVIRRLCEIVNGIIDAATNVNFYEYDAHPLDDIAVNPDWAYWDNGYAESSNSRLWAHAPLYPPLLFTDREGYVCAAYDDGNDSNGGNGGGGDIK